MNKSLELISIGFAWTMNSVNGSFHSFYVFYSCRKQFGGMVRKITFDFTYHNFSVEVELDDKNYVFITSNVNAMQYFVW